MQSFWAIIHFAVFLSDWFIAHSNKRTERIKYTLWTGMTSQPFWKARAVGILLLSPRPYRCLSADSCISSLFCKSVTQFHLRPNNHYCRNWSPSAKRFLQNMGLNMPLLYSLAGWASLATPCKSHNMVQFYTSNAILTPNNKSQELWSMEKRKPQTNKTEKDARVLTSVYFLSYHSLKLLSNSIKKRQNRSIPVDIF